MSVLARPACAARTPAGVEGWGRRRLLAAAIGVVLTATALLVGLGYAVYPTLAPSPHPAAAASSGEGSGRPSSRQESVEVRRDSIAAAPMLAVTPQDALPAPPSTQTAPGIVIPPASSSGAAGVPTGYPHTPEGAVAQLAAIETTVFQAMSMPLTAEVHRHWTLPDQPPITRPDAFKATDTEAGTIELDLDLDLDHDAAAGAQAAGGLAGWEIARHVQSFLGTAQMGPEKDLTATVTATPAASLIKGTDGPDWVLACVLLDVRAVITTEARIGYGHCERMQWHDGRWLIAPGPPPARAPSTWPGSQASIEAGWLTWVDADLPLDTGSTTAVPGAGLAGEG